MRIVKKICKNIKGKRLTGVSTPFFGLSWDDKKVDSGNIIQLDYKIRVFISSICGDNGRYDSIRNYLKEQIEKTGIAQVYIFGERPKTITAFNDYTWSVEESDVCIFIIDNKDGITEGVQNEIDVVHRNGIKALYYFCTEYSNEKTKLQLSLEGPGKPTYKVISSFDELMRSGVKNLLEEIITTYHNYCKGHLIESESEVDVSISGVTISEIEKIEDKYLPKITFENLDKSANYILKKILPKACLGYELRKNTSILDDCELSFLNVLYGEKNISDILLDTFFDELRKIQDEEYLNIVKLRWKGICAYFKGDLQECILEYQKAYKEAKEKGVSSWILQDILIDIRNINILNGEIISSYSLEAQKELNAIGAQFHYPVLDRIDKTIEDKYIVGLYKKKIDSPNTVYLGSDFSEYGELFASKILIAMYNGSLTHIRLFFDEMKAFMFYLTEKYSDWIIRKNLLKYAIISSDEKEINRIVEAYPELLNNMSAIEALEIIDFCECVPVIYYRNKALIKALGVVGYYLHDESFNKCEKRILEYLFEMLQMNEVPYLLMNIMFKNLKKVVLRLSQDKFMELCLCIMKKNHSICYTDMFKFIERIELANINEELRKRLIIHIEELLYDNNGDIFTQRILVHIRNSDRVNTERLNDIIKEKYPEYYYNSYLIDTCNGDRNVYMKYLSEIKASIIQHNRIQGKNGVLYGYARRDYISLRNIIKNGFVPEDTILYELMNLAFETIEESKDTTIIKTDAVEFIIMVLSEKPDYRSYYMDKIEILYDNKNNIIEEKYFDISNVNPVALEFAIVLLKSIISKEDLYYELMNLITVVKEDTATLMRVVGIIRRFYEQGVFTMSERVEIMLLTNVLFWIINDNMEIRWNSYKILFQLKKRFADSNLIDRKLYDLMDNECAQIKNLVLSNLNDISIEKKLKAEIIEKARLDNNYLVRLKAEELYSM